MFAIDWSKVFVYVASGRWKAVNWQSESDFDTVKSYDYIRVTFQHGEGMFGKCIYRGSSIFEQTNSFMFAIL